jgi:hypothetical protein
VDLGATVHFLKVLSHTGLPGNEAADTAAGRVAHDNTIATVTDPSDPNTLHQLFWVAKERPTRDSPSAKLSFASDRDHGLKKLLAECPRTHRGDAPRTEKGKEWEAALPTLDARISNLDCPSRPRLSTSLDLDSRPRLSFNGTDIWTSSSEPPHLDRLI